MWYVDYNGTLLYHPIVNNDSVINAKYGEGIVLGCSYSTYLNHDYSSLIEPILQKVRVKFSQNVVITLFREEIEVIDLQTF